MNYIKQFEERGVSFSVTSDGGLRCKALPGIMTPTLVEQIRQRKSELIAEILLQSTGFAEKPAGANSCSSGNEPENSQANNLEACQDHRKPTSSPMMVLTDRKETIAGQNRAADGFDGFDASSPFSSKAGDKAELGEKVVPKDIYRIEEQGQKPSEPSYFQSFQMVDSSGDPSGPVITHQELVSAEISVTLPNQCPLRTGLFSSAVRRLCRFDVDLLRRLISDGTLPVSISGCPVIRACRLGQTGSLVTA